MDVRIFVSYSHRDRNYIGKDEMLEFLRGLERDGGVRFWVDDNLSGGVRWDQEIRAQLESAHIALVLVSQAFLDSDYCVNVEISSFLDKRRRDGLRIFPVVLSACEWDRHPWLSEHQMLPGGQETIEENYSDTGARKRLYLKIRKELRQAVEEAARSADRREEPRVAETVAERRHITLLQCSLSVTAGGDPLDRDEEAEILYEVRPQFLDRVRAQVQAVEGLIVGENSGGILASFGYPVLHEDDRVRATRAGIGIAAAVGALSDDLVSSLGVELSVRVGIESGTAICGGGAETVKELERCETQSIAAMLAATGPADSVVVGDGVEHAVHGFFEMERLADVEHPALRKRFRCWRIVADSGDGTRFQVARRRGLHDMVGRDAELALIRNAWRDARDGAGKAVMLIAEPGIGKSRLLEEFRRSAQREPHASLELSASPYHRNSALFPVIRMVRGRFSVSVDEPYEEQRSKVLAGCRKLALPEEAASGLIDLLGIPDASGSGLSAKQMKDRAFNAVLMLLAAEAEQTPVLLMVEDMHWMDPSTEELLGQLIAELRDLPVLVLFTARPEYKTPQEWTSLDYFIPLRLGPLTAAQVAQMAMKVAGGMLPGEILVAVIQKCEGCPLFVEDLVNAVINSGLVEKRGDAFVSTRPFESLMIPDTLQEVLLAGLGKVEDARIVAQLGSVVGREFDQEVIEALAPMPPDEIRECLGKLVAAGLVNRRGLLKRARYTFKHALVQDAIYQSLLKRDRRRYHRTLAEILASRFPEMARRDPEMHAHHYHEGGMAAQAIGCWMAAARDAIRNCANTEALHLAGKALHALGEVPDADERARLELQLQLMRGPALLAVKGWSSPEIGDAYRRARALLPAEEDAGRRFRITRGLWGYYMVSNQLAASLALSEELWQIAETENSDDFRLEAHVTFCDTYFWMGRLRLSMEHAEAGLKIYDLDLHHVPHSERYGEDPSVVLQCYGALCHWHLGDDARAEEIVANAVANVERYTHLFSRGFLLNGIAWYYIHAGNPRLARQYGAVLNTLSKEQGFPPWEALSHTHRGWADALLGDPAGGVEQLRRGMSDTEATGILITKLLNSALLAEALLLAGNRADALQCIETGLAHAENSEERYFLPELWRRKAEMMLESDGATPACLECYRKAIEISREQGSARLEERATAGLKRIAQSAAAS